jgi:hypothetical protein
MEVSAMALPSNVLDISITVRPSSTLGESAIADPPLRRVAPIARTSDARILDRIR